ncbi:MULTISPECIES: AbrB/MazE/SpoVT family DNA-binding domain-containing protein [Alicyclobacillus]|uniref:AbrB/MazE/SpoVT family DNA-binding domain-containing protein n=1 Tax=Alicyclobacillus TaxID=29330 RepID=UPI001A8CFED2|nr:MULTISPECIES: AbrB/MazE/SpoVT family DNA-binding domain-containing protein [Alicyclobacillus]
MGKDAIVRMDEKGRLTIPRNIREALHAKPGDVFFLQEEQGGLRIIKGENPFDALAEEAVREYEAGTTISLEEFAQQEGMTLDKEA